MFKDIREGSIIYVLNKQEYTETTATVTKFNIRSKYTQPNVQPPFVMQTTDNVVDITIRTDGNTYNLEGLPAVSSVADYTNGIVYYSDLESMIADVRGILNNSQNIINSYDNNVRIAESCKTIIEKYDPLKGDKKIAQMEKQLSDMTADFKELQSTILQFMSSNVKKNES